MTEKTPKQFRFDKAGIKKDGITETMRIFTGDENKPETTEHLPPLTDADLDEDFDFGLSIDETNGQKDTELDDSPFDMRISMTPENPIGDSDNTLKKTNIELGPLKDDQDITSVAKKAAETRTVIHKQNLLDAITRIKEEESKKKKNK